MSRMFRVSVAVALCVCAYPSLALAQDDAFKQGLQARGDKKWQDVVRHMRTAIQADPKESTRKIRSGFLGVQGTEYLPHYFLGEASLNLGDCATAVTEWSTSEQQNAVRSRADLVVLMQKGYQTCASKGVLLPADFIPLLNSTRQVYVDASALAKRVVDLGNGHREAWRPESDEQYKRARAELETAQVKLASAMRTRLASEFAEVRLASERAIGVLRPLEASLNETIETHASAARQLRDVEELISGADAADRAVDSLKVALTEPLAASRKTGREQLAQAREKLKAAQQKPNPATASEALKYAQSASGTFNQVLEQVKKIARVALEQQLGNAVKAADEAFSFVSASFTTLDRRAAKTSGGVQPEVASARAALQKQVETLRRRFDRARRAEDLASLTETTRQTLEAQSALDALIKSFGPLTLRDRGVHAALEDGVRLFLEGSYDKALAALDPPGGLSDVPLQLHVHLFRAAALYKLFVRSGQTNQQLRTQALAEIELCKQLNSAFQPDQRVFDPRFLVLYQTGGPPAPQAVAATEMQR
jgi:hypothetical protein